MSSASVLPQRGERPERSLSYTCESADPLSPRALVEVDGACAGGEGQGEGGDAQEGEPEVVGWMYADE